MPGDITVRVQNKQQRLDLNIHELASIPTPIADSDGKPLKMFETHSGITERKLAEELLKQSEAKYRALIDLTATGYLILDFQGRVLDANQEYVRLSGYATLHDILGKSVLEWTAERAKPRNAEAVAECLQNGFIKAFETEYVDADGKITPVEINASVDGSGESLRILSLCRDIIERKQAEESVRK